MSELNSNWENMGSKIQNEIENIHRSFIEPQFTMIEDFDARNIFYPAFKIINFQLH